MTLAATLLWACTTAWAAGLPPLVKADPARVSASIRLRRTRVVIDGQPMSAGGADCIQDQCYQWNVQPTWTQRTRVSAQVADSRWVGLTLSTDGDFRTFRSLAASYLGERWEIGVQYGAFPQEYTNNTTHQTQAGYFFDPDVLPEDNKSPRTYRGLEARAVMVNGSGIDLYLGARWLQTTTPITLQQLGQDGVNDDEVLSVFDTHGRLNIVGITGSADSSRYVLRRPCKKAVCVRPALGADLMLGVGHMGASDDASERYERIHSEGPSAAWGIGFQGEAHAGAMVLTQRPWGTLGVDLGYSAENVAFRAISSDRTTFDGIGVPDEGGVQSKDDIYHGPYVQGTGRF